jgi:ribose 5-phosphate isomerase RpiB
MAIQEDQVDKIVREVLSRLSGKPEAKVVGPSSPVKELATEETVVTVATLSGKLAGIRRLVVSPRAVVTPSACDLLKENNVTLVRSLRTAKSAVIRIALAVVETKFDASEIVRSLQQHRAEVDQLALTEIGSATKKLAEEVSEGGRLGVLISPAAAKALCIANRHCGVRAAQASSRGEVSEIIKAIGANLLVVDSARRSRFEVQRIVEAFCLAGPRESPAELKSSLE